MLCELDSLKELNKIYENEIYKKIDHLGSFKPINNKIFLITKGFDLFEKWKAKVWSLKIKKINLE